MFCVVFGLFRVAMISSVALVYTVMRCVVLFCVVCCVLCFVVFGLCFDDVGLCVAHTFICVLCCIASAVCLRCLAVSYCNMMCYFKNHFFKILYCVYCVL